MNSVRESISIENIDKSKLYYNPGCALNLYKEDEAKQMLHILEENFEGIKRHDICCRHNPNLPSGSVIIANCAGCDRRFRSLYEGVETISLWEALDSIENLNLPKYDGLKVSVHDSCGYRHKPQVHNAVRSLLKKMNIEIEEAKFYGENSVCCGDNLYGLVDEEVVSDRIIERANQFPCDDVVVYCIGCVRALQFGGKQARYLIDLILGLPTEKMTDSLEIYHKNLDKYIKAH